MSHPVSRRSGYLFAAVGIIAGITLLTGAWQVRSSAPTTKVAAPTTVQSSDLIVCEHLDMPYSEYQCPDTVSFASYSDIQAISLVVTLNNGKQVTKKIVPTADAIFLTRRAVSDFLLVHYDKTAPKKAAALRAQFFKVKKPK